MSNLNRHPVRRTAAGVLAGALAFSGAFAAGSPAFGAAGFNLERVAGNDRYATSAAIAAQFGAADGAILASGEAGHVVDALSASFLAGVRQDPVLLTSRGMVSTEVLAQLNALTNKRVTIVGGVAAVSAAVEAQLRTAGFTVTRLAGANRYQTSEAVIRAGASEGDESNIGILASGQSPIDALAVGALAYKGKHPVFLTAGGMIPQATLDAMVAAGTRQVIIVGGTTVVPEAVRAQLAARNITVVTRLGGVDRSETSRLVAEYLIANQGFDATTFNVASGANNGVDALSGAALSGKNNRVLLVTNTATNAGSVDDFARARAATLTAVGRIFGGPAVITPALEAEIETAGGAAAGPVALRAATVAQGGSLTGTITGDFSSVTVSGCGFNNQTIGADDDTATTGRQFTLNVGSGQAVGNCDVTFTFTPTGGGATFTQVVRVAVTQATVVSATVRPELQSATITGTVVSGTETAANPVGTSVRYVFDEVVTAPQVAGFMVYDAAANRTAATAVTLESGGRSVVARFASFNTATLAANLTVATVDAGAVLDLDGNASPEGDAAIGTAVAAGGAGALPAGITDGPDLLTVGNFRAAAQDTQTAVDFTFDEAATLVGDVTGFNLVRQNGEVISARPIAELPFGSTSGGTAQGGNNTTTFTLVFTNPDRDSTGGADTGDVTAAELNRGFVLAGSVRDTATPTANQNVTQAADVAGGTPTLQPDLVSVAFRPSADTTADQVLFTFDQAVNTTTAASNFVLYQADGDLVTGATTAVVNPQNTSQVLVSFADQALVDVVGAQALAGAVTSASLSEPNRIDEEGAAGTSAASSGRTPGQTAAPDLTGVSLATTTDAFGNVGNFAATYTFDQDVSGTAGGGGAPTALGEFNLYLANGTQLVATACTVGNTEATDNTVTCTTFNVLGGAGATNTQVGSATLGTVDNGAVTGTGTATTISGTASGPGNPEGASLITGGTGTRTN